MPESLLYDVVIIGGGPAGLTAAQYCARAKLKTIVLDKSASAGALAYASVIENYPGLEKPVSGRDLLNRFRDQAIKFGAQYIESQVIGVSLKGEIKEVHTMETSYQTKTIIIATGAMGRKPTIKGEAEFLGKGVSYCAVCDAAFFKGKRVGVLGDSEEALKEAIFLTKFAEQVYLISPSKKLKVDEKQYDLSIDKLQILTGQTVVSIEGSETVEKIIIRDYSGTESYLDLSGVFIYLYGTKPITDFLHGSLELLDNDCIAVNKLMESNVPGVFAAGDVTCTEVRQVVVAAAQGCLAALSAEKYLFQRKRMKYDWHK